MTRTATLDSFCQAIEAADLTTADPARLFTILETLKPDEYALVLGIVVKLAGRYASERDRHRRLETA